ncbi:MAG: cation:proton antiporter [Gammaproteobacteria bacterium]|nr:cation:proton antiporter [Pseudomonadales bacterium]
MADYLLLVFIFLASGVIAVPIATRYGLGSVLGYLLAGMVIAPLLRFLSVDVEAIQHVAEFGVVIMLFLVGLELEPGRIWRLRNRLFGLGGLQVGATALLVMTVFVLLGYAWQVSLTVGLVFSLSSTAIVLQSLNEKGLMRSDGGQSAFSVLLFQDIAVIPMLAFIPLLANPELLGLAGSVDDHAENTLSLVAGLNTWAAAGVTVAVIAAVTFGGKRLTGPLFDFIAVTRLRELFTATALMVVVAVALLMLLVGLSPALGTFIAGVVLANSHYRHELEADIEPFKGLLLGLFFITVGAGIDFGLLRENLQFIALGTVALILLKLAVLLGLGRAFGLQGANNWLFALSLAQAGEFGFVLLAFSVTNGVLPEALSEQLLLVVALSMLITPLLFIVYEKLIAPRYAVKQQEADNIDEVSEIIVAGHGRFGGIVNRMLRGMGFETTAVDYSAEQLNILRRFGVKAYYGDATRPDLLHAAGIDSAKLLVIAIDDREQVTRLTRYVIEKYPHVHVIARAWDRNHVYELWSIGCRDVIRETYDSAIRAGRSALEALGIPKQGAQEMAEAFENMDRSSMVELASLYQIDIPNHENPEFVARYKEIRDEWGRQLMGKVQEIRLQSAREVKGAEQQETD